MRVTEKGAPPSLWKATLTHRLIEFLPVIVYMALHQHYKWELTNNVIVMLIIWARYCI